MTDFVGECLGKKYKQAKYPLPNDIDEYLTWDDDLIYNYAKTESDSKSHNLAWRILDRHHYEVVYETYPHTDRLTPKNICTFSMQEEYKDHKFWLDPAGGHPEAFRQQDLVIYRR